MFKLQYLNLVVETDSIAKRDELLSQGYVLVEDETPSVVLKSSEELKEELKDNTGDTQKTKDTADTEKTTEKGKETTSEVADQSDLEKLYKKYTVDQLRVMADEKGKTFTEDMSKKELFNLVFGE